MTGHVSAQDAAEVLKRVEMRRGLCCVLGAQDARFPLALTAQSELLVHVLDSDEQAVQRLSVQARQAGYPIQRLLVERGSLNRLPYADNSLDLLVLTRAGQYGRLEVSEVLRALRPAGVAIVRTAGNADDSSGRLTSDAIKKWLGEIEDVESWSDADGRWVQFSKPVPFGLGEWSHWEKSPDNNPVSDDTLIKAPYMTQFMAKPWYIGMPAVTTAAGGRTFLAMGHIAHHEREWGALNRLIARNGFNGTVLWERKLPDDYLVHRSAFIATPEIFYMIDGDHCLLLDAATGEERGRLKIPGVQGAWKWIALENGILYALAGAPGDGVELVKGKRALGGWSWADLSQGYYGKRIPHGFGDVVAAYELDTKRVLWTHREKSLIDSRGLAIRDNQFYLYCPERHLRALDYTTGEIRWTADDPDTLNLIETPGKGLTSTPGWRTQTLVVATPDALVIQGQTRMNVIGLSTADGSLLWHRPKVTNNPNAIYVDGKVVIGVGERGSHLVLDPLTGRVEDNLKFSKRACTRLTASSDSFFVRGEGMTRFDRESKTVQIDGAVRPACNDGVIPANGLIYLGPWACDCNLSLIGNVARCSAGDFRFDFQAVDAERLERHDGKGELQPFEIRSADWSTYRGNRDRSAATNVSLKRITRVLWQHRPALPVVSTDPTTAGGFVFLGGEDGLVRAIDSQSGALLWSFQTGGPIKYPPTLADQRAYVGSADGYAYCLEAATGQLLWRFRAAPVERRIMVYDSLSSTWPVNTGVLVHDGVAYFGAGIVDHDGTYLYAVDAHDGVLVWQNNSSGHLNADLRKGVSVQGNLTVLDDALVLAGGNVVSPARFDLHTGRCLETARQQGQPQSNGGRFVGVLDGQQIVTGGRILYSSPKNVSTKGSFDVWSTDRRSLTLNYGGILPAWNTQTVAVANFKYGRITAIESAALKERIQTGFGENTQPRNRFARTLVNLMSTRNQIRWQSNLGDSSGFEALSIVVAPNAVLTVARYQDLRRAVPQYFLTALASDDGRQLFQVELPEEPLPGSLAVDRDGHVLVGLLSGGLVCLAP